MSLQPDRVETLVAAAIDAAQSRDQDRIMAAYRALSPLDVGDVLAELFVCVEDLTAGVDLDDLLVAAGLPPRTTILVAAIRNQDLPALLAALDRSEVGGALATLMVLVATLKGARERLAVDQTA